MGPALRRFTLGVARTSAGRAPPHERRRQSTRSAINLRDGAYVAKLMPFLRLACKLWFRSEVRGMENVPDGGALIVSNHSGGAIAMDVPVIAVAFFDHFGPDRPLYVLAHDMLFMGRARTSSRKAGFLPATRENADAA